MSFSKSIKNSPYGEMIEKSFISKSPNISREICKTFWTKLNSSGSKAMKQDYLHLLITTFFDHVISSSNNKDTMIQDILLTIINEMNILEDNSTLPSPEEQIKKITKKLKDIPSSSLYHPYCYFIESILLAEERMGDFLYFLLEFSFHSSEVHRYKQSISPEHKRQELEINLIYPLKEKFITVMTSDKELFFNGIDSIQENLVNLEIEKCNNYEKTEIKLLLICEILEESLKKLPLDVLTPEDASTKNLKCYLSPIINTLSKFLMCEKSLSVSIIKRIFFLEKFIAFPFHHRIYSLSHDSKKLSIIPSMKTSKNEYFYENLVALEKLENISERIIEPRSQNFFDFAVFINEKKDQLDILEHLDTVEYKESLFRLGFSMGLNQEKITTAYDLGKFLHFQGVLEEKEINSLSYLKFEDCQIVLENIQKAIKKLSSLFFSLEVLNYSAINNKLREYLKTVKNEISLMVQKGRDESGKEEEFDLTKFSQKVREIKNYLILFSLSSTKSFSDSFYYFIKDLVETLKSKYKEEKSITLKIIMTGSGSEIFNLINFFSDNIVSTENNKIMVEGFQVTLSIFSIPYETNVLDCFISEGDLKYSMNISDFVCSGSKILPYPNDKFDEGEIKQKMKTVETIRKRAYTNPETLSEKTTTSFDKPRRSRTERLTGKFLNKDYDLKKILENSCPHKELNKSLIQYYIEETDEKIPMNIFRVKIKRSDNISESESSENRSSSDSASSLDNMRLTEAQNSKGNIEDSSYKFGTNCELYFLRKILIGKSGSKISSSNDTVFCNLEITLSSGEVIKDDVRLVYAVTYGFSISQKSKDFLYPNTKINYLKNKKLNDMVLEKDSKNFIFHLNGTSFSSKQSESEIFSRGDMFYARKVSIKTMNEKKYFEVIVDNKLVQKISSVEISPFWKNKEEKEINKIYINGFKNK